MQVYTAPCFRMAHRLAGRWHRTPTCAALWSPGSAREGPTSLGSQLQARTIEEAEMLQYTECPYCCPQPRCCAAGHPAAGA